MNLLGFGKQRLAEERVGSKMQRSHSWDSSFPSLRLKAMKKREKQLQSRRGGLGVKERQLQYDNREEHDLPAKPDSSRRLVLWNPKDGEEPMEEEMPPISKELQQQLFVQRLFLLSRKEINDTPPERRMSLLSTRSPGGTGLSGKDLEPQRSLLTIGPQASYVSGQQNSGYFPSKPTSSSNDVSGKGRQSEQPWTVETVVTNFTSSCTVFDSLCTPSFSLLPTTRQQEKRRNGAIPPPPPNKRRTLSPLEQPIPIPVTISFTKQGPPQGWEEMSLERHFTDLEKYEKGIGGDDIFAEADPIMEDRQKEEEDHASSTGFISLTSSIPTRRSHGLWSTTDLHYQK